MTKVTVYKTSSGYKGFKCTGHSGFSSAGKDIVCAAISVLTINTINSLETISKDDMNVRSDEDKGIIDVEFKNDLSHDGKVLIDSMILGLKDIEKQYGAKYLRLDLKEV